MKKITYISLLFLMLFSAVSYGQNISNQVISAYGLSAANASAQIDVTIGEPVVKTVTNGSNTLTQGFYQTNLVITTIKENETSNNYQFYPNPVNEMLTFHINQTIKEVVSLQLFDVNGKLLWSKENASKNEQISFVKYPKGVYFMKVVNDKQQAIKTIKIIK